MGTKLKIASLGCLLIKYEKHRKLIKSTISEQEKLTADVAMKRSDFVEYDLFEKIEHYNGIDIIKKLQKSNESYYTKSKKKGTKKNVKAATNLLNLYIKMKEKFDSEMRVEVVDQGMKKVSVNSNQSGNEALPRRLILRSSKKRPLCL